VVSDVALERLTEWLLGGVTTLVWFALYAPVLVVALFSVFEVNQQKVDFSASPSPGTGALLHNAGILAATAQQPDGAVPPVCDLSRPRAAHRILRQTTAQSRPAVSWSCWSIRRSCCAIITGLSLVIFFREVGSTQPVTVTIGLWRSCWRSPYRLLMTRLRVLSRSMVEASYDLARNGLADLPPCAVPHMRSAWWPPACWPASSTWMRRSSRSFSQQRHDPADPAVGMMRVGFTPEINAW